MSFFRAIVFHVICATLSAQLCWGAPVGPAGLVRHQAQEYDLKAVYLYNFLQFVQWPASHKSPSSDGAMVIGIVGESPFGNALNNLQENLLKNGMKPIRVVYYGHFREGMNLEECHLLFVCASEKKSFRRIVATLRDTSVLTVADTESFLAAGGMITMVQNQAKIRWLINRAAASRTGLRLSPQLLSIALKVVDES